LSQRVPSRLSGSGTEARLAVLESMLRTTSGGWPEWLRDESVCEALLRSSAGRRSCAAVTRLAALASRDDFAAAAAGRSAAFLIYQAASLLESRGELAAARRLFAALPEGRNTDRDFCAGCYFHVARIDRSCGNFGTAARAAETCLSLCPEHKAAAELLRETARLVSCAPAGSCEIYMEARTDRRTAFR